MRAHSLSCPISSMADLQPYACMMLPHLLAQVVRDTWLPIYRRKRNPVGGDPDFQLVSLGFKSSGLDPISFSPCLPLFLFLSFSPSPPSSLTLLSCWILRAVYPQLESNNKFYTLKQNWDDQPFVSYINMNVCCFEPDIQRRLRGHSTAIKLYCVVGGVE